MLINLLNITTWIIFWYFIFLNLGYILLLIFSVKDVYDRFKETKFCNIDDLMESHTLPPVTVLVPVYNEADNIFNCIQSLLQSNYPNTNIIIINDGSTDETMEILTDIYKLQKKPRIKFSKKTALSTIKVAGKLKESYISLTHPNLTVIDKTNSGKSDALNFGLNACRTPLFITMDGDSVIEKNAINEILFYMLIRPHTIAVGGAVYASNNCEISNGVLLKSKISYNPIVGFQIIEYLRAFTFGRSGWNAFGGPLCYSGTFTLFQHDAVLRIGGFEEENVAQDFEIITHLLEYGKSNHNPCRIGYTIAAAVWTEVPSTFSEYWHQRKNWQYYSLYSILLYKKMFLNPKYGILGLFSYPFFLLGELLGGVVEFIAYSTIILSWYLGILNYPMLILFLLLCFGVSIFLTMASVLINYISFTRYKDIRNLFWMLFLSIIECVGFRQFSVTCRTFATIQYCIKSLVAKKKHKKS